MTDEEIKLPEGYYFADRSSVTLPEFAEIRRSVNWSDDDEERFQKCFEQSLEIIAVRSADGLLVGIGFIAGNYRHAVLCDFNVRKDHQRKGIGRAILQARIQRAEELKIPYLYVSLHPSNPLRSLYEQLGFREGDGSMFREKRY